MTKPVPSEFVELFVLCVRAHLYPDMSVLDARKCMESSMRSLRVEEMRLYEYIVFALEWQGKLPKTLRRQYEIEYNKIRLVAA